MAVYCSRCSTANREGSRFCNNCGAALSEPARQVCAQCQTAVYTYSAFCHHCGARLPEPEQPPVTAPEPITEMDDGSAGAAEEENEVISLSQVPLDSRPVASLAATAPDVAADGEPEKVALSEVEAEAQAALPVVAEPSPETTAVQPVENEPEPEMTAQQDMPEPEPEPVEPPVEAPVEAPAEAPVEPPVEAAVATPPAAVQATRPMARVRPSPGAAATTPAAATPQRVAGSDNWRRLAYAALATAIIVGLFLPTGTLGRSSPPSESVKALYSTIDALPAHANVLVAFDYEPSTSDEMQPLAQAIVSHLMQKKARLYTFSLLAQGPALADQVLAPLAKANIYSYGVDYVHLGYLPGDEAALAALNGDIKQVFTSDFVYGRPLTSFTMGGAITSAASADLIVEISDDEGGVRRWVEQVQQRSATSMVAATSAAALPLAFPYLQSGQILGLAGGLPAAAEYETLLGQTGPATRGMDAQSLGHLVILLLIILGNLSLLLPRRRETGEETGAAAP